MPANIIISPQSAFKSQEKINKKIKKRLFVTVLKHNSIICLTSML